MSDVPIGFAVPLQEWLTKQSAGHHCDAILMVIRDTFLNTPMTPRSTIEMQATAMHELRLRFQRGELRRLPLGVCAMEYGDCGNLVLCALVTEDEAMDG